MPPSSVRTETSLSWSLALNGAACTTPEGQPGTCTEISVSRPDYSSGIPPKYTQVKMLGCVAVAKASSKVALPWVGVGLAFLAMLAAFGASRWLGGSVEGRSSRANSRDELAGPLSHGPSTPLEVSGEDPSRS